MTVVSITRMIADLEYVAAILRGGKLMPKPQARDMLADTLDAIRQRIQAKANGGAA